MRDENQKMQRGIDCSFSFLKKKKKGLKKKKSNQFLSASFDFRLASQRTHPIPKEPQWYVCELARVVRICRLWSRA
jgi:hypothetical protein